MNLTKRVRLVTAYIGSTVTGVVGALVVLGAVDLTGEQVGAVSLIASAGLGLAVVVTQAVTGTEEA